MTDLAGSAVDLFDAAARLESRGYGDAAAARLGHPTVFELAETVLRRARPTRVGLETRNSGERAWTVLGRLIVLAGGVLMSLACLPAQASVELLFIAGAAGWVSGQTVASGTWSAMSSSGRTAAATAAAFWTVAVLMPALAAGFVLGSPVPLLWAMWGAASAILLILEQTGRVAGAVALAATVTGVGVVISDRVGLVFAVCSISGALVWAALLLRRIGSRAELPSWSTVGAAILGAAQSLAQVAMLLIVLLLVPLDSFAAVAIAALVVTALTDPVLGAVHAAVRWLVARSTAWVRGRRLAGLLGAWGLLVIVACAALAGVLIGDLLAPGQDNWPIVTATALLATLAMGTGMLLRVGATLAAMLLASVEATFAGILFASFQRIPDADASLLLLTLSMASVLITGALMVTRLSRPVAW